MAKNKFGEDPPIPKFIHLKIRRRDGVESLTTLEEGEFKVFIDGCINPRLTKLFFVTRLTKRAGGVVTTPLPRFSEPNPL